MPRRPIQESIDVNGEPSCGQPMEAHFAALLMAIIANGAGFDCSGVYHALVEIAETYRVVGGFRDYSAQQQGVIAESTKAIQTRLKAGSLDANDDDVLDAEIVPDEPDVKREYDSLTAEQKKRFN